MERMKVPSVLSPTQNTNRESPAVVGKNSEVALPSDTTLKRNHKRSVDDGDEPVFNPHADDSFVLELEAYNKTFCLHLHPNYDLLHPEAKFTQPGYLMKREEPLRREQVKAYRGYVMDVDDHHSGANHSSSYRCEWRRLEPRFENYGDTRGWARLIVKDSS